VLALFELPPKTAGRKDKACMAANEERFKGAVCGRMSKSSDRKNCPRKAISIVFAAPFAI
jgi:hypothetical protein